MVLFPVIGPWQKENTIEEKGSGGETALPRVKILLVEDEADIRDLIKLSLSREGHNVLSVSNGADAIDIVKREHFDIFILDRMLPEKSGLEICRFIRSYESTKESPILMVTAITSPDAIIEGLDAGADDYITKPFDLSVLMARTRSLIRRLKILDEYRSSDKEPEILKVGPFELDRCKYEFRVLGDNITLTKSEFSLMQALMKNVGRVLGRDELVSEIQGNTVHVTNRTVDTHVFGLRKKLGESAALVESIRGIGYRINERP